MKGSISIPSAKNSLQSSIVLLFFATACSSASVHRQLPPTAEPTVDVDRYQISEVTYELDSGWGINETDKIIFRQDGTAEFIAHLGLALENTYVPVEQRLSGRFRGSIDPNEFRRLTTVIVQYDFFSRNDRYSSGVADGSTVTTSVQYAGGRKTVVNYARGGDDEVGAIERELISLAKKIEWAKGRQ